MAKKVILQKLGKSQQFMVTVPKSIAEVKGWQKGDRLYWSEAGLNSLILSKEEK